MWFDQTDLPWVKPSPAMASLQSTILYPGICFFEATNVDCRIGSIPFTKVGAPWMDGERYAEALSLHALKGVRFAPFHQDDQNGVSIVVTDRDTFDPVLTGLVMISEALRLYPRNFTIEPHGFDEMTGESWIREALLKGERPEAIAKAWQGGTKTFLRERAPYLLYP